MALQSAKEHGSTGVQSSFDILIPLAAITQIVAFIDNY